MICVYPADCTDFSTNGNGTLAPLSAEVTETLNGEYELTLVQVFAKTNASWYEVTAPISCIARFEKCRSFRFLSPCPDISKRIRERTRIPGLNIIHPPFRHVGLPRPPGDPEQLPNILLWLFRSS